MAIRDIIPWNRQENGIPVPVRAELAQDQGHHPLLSLHREVNRLFDDVFRSFSAPALGGFDRAGGWPHIELAGLAEKDVDLSVEEGVLTLRGEKRAEVENKDRGYSERSYGRFERRIGLPRGIDREQASATFADGLLTVVLPKTEAANENVRRIPVHGKAA
jgi:HSP20 family protein